MDPEPATRLPGVSEVEQITNLTDPAVRNLRITQCYHQLSSAMIARTGPGANWCTFATWASRQAGQTIRGEDLAQQLERSVKLPAKVLQPIQSLWRALLRRGIFRPEARLGRLVREIHSPFDAFERASDAVARGNRKVFEEIGWHFARYLHECPADAAAESEVFQSFLEKLRAGDPPEGQSYLRKAFTRYQAQRFQSQANARAQLVFLANLEIGLHEQTRLQPEIREAMDSATSTAEDLGARSLAVLFPGSAGWWSVARTPLAALLDRLARSFLRFAQGVSRQVVTDCLMVLGLPGGDALHLGQNLAAPFPEILSNLDNADAVRLLGRFEPPPSTPDDCGARDWSELSQRMHYIVHLFRAFHERADLHQPPFTPEQVRVIRSGVVPDGDL